MAAGDVVCVLSDGVTEAASAAHALYGAGRVEQALAKVASAAGAVHALRDDVKRFARDVDQSDDITVLALRWTAERTV